MKLGMICLLMAGSALFHLGCGSGGGGSIPTCSGTFTACGGDLTGKWAIDGVCIEGSVTNALSSNGEVPPECSDMIKDVSVQMSGTVEFKNGTQTSDVNQTMTMGFKLDSACFSAMNKTSMTMSQQVCDLFGSTMSNMDEEDGQKVSAKCSYSGNVCNCTMTMSGQDKTSTTYTISGSTLTTDDGDEVDYCVSGKNLTTREKSSSGTGSQIKFHKI